MKSPAPSRSRSSPASSRYSYFLAKAARACGTVAAIVLLAFALSHASGDPAQVFLGGEATPEAVHAFREKWGLDKPLAVQLARYVVLLSQGDLGKSLYTSRKVTEVIAERIPATLSLMIPVAFLAISLGILIGTAAAIRNGRLSDKAILLGSTLGFSLPNFFLGIVLIFTFSVGLALLPSSGNMYARSFIMPIMTLVLADVAVFTRFARASMIDILGKYYILSFRSLGVKEWRILLFQALPNASIALLTISGFYIGSLVGGAIVTETIFAWPGVGSLLISAIRSRDFPLVQGLILLFGLSIVAANLAVDFLYGVIDPRVRKGVSS